MVDLAAYTQKRRELIDGVLHGYLSEDLQPALLYKAMAYSVFSGGKRFRPILCLAAAQAIGGEDELALIPAAAIELLHTYSLIHDDLPALDDDTERRGKPTNHVVFGEAQALLAGDGLLTLAFEVMAQSTPKTFTAADLCLELAKAGGPQGMVAGQVEDVLAENQEVNEGRVVRIHTLKTMVLMRAAVRIGAMTYGASETQLTALTTYAEKLGMAYQF